MDEAHRPTPVRDALVTILGVWAALILAAFAGLRLQPGLAGATVSVGVFLILLFAWGHWTGPGRRTHLGVYLAAGLLYWVLCTTLFLLAPATLMDGPLSWLAVGTTIGYQYAGGPHAPLGYYIVPMVLNLFGPILIMGLLRRWLRLRGV
jgi:hypothetical protein